MTDSVTNGLLELRISPGAGAGFLVGRYIGTNDALRVEFLVYFLTVNELTGAFGARHGLAESFFKIRLAMALETLRCAFDQVFAAGQALGGGFGVEFPGSRERGGGGLLR
jgi:hypothetical protein